MKFNRNEKYAQHLGRADKVKFEQNGFLFDNTGECLGSFDKDKNIVPLDIAVDDMNRPQLLQYALDNFGIKLKGNSKTVDLIAEIKALEKNPPETTDDD